MKKSKNLFNILFSVCFLCYVYVIGAENAQAIFFCAEDRKINGRCVYYQKAPEEKLLQATVSLVTVNNGRIANWASGTVIKLKKEGKTCKMPLLLTCEHCVDLSKMSTKTVTAYNHIDAARIELHEMEELQAPRDHSGKRDCIDIDSEICLIDSSSRAFQ